MATIDAKSKMIPFNISIEKTSKDRIIKSTNAPKDTNALWAEPTDIGDGKFILKEFKKGKWEPVDFLEGSGNSSGDSSGNSGFAYSKLAGTNESTQSWLGIHDSNECSEFGQYGPIACFSKKDITDKIAVIKGSNNGPFILGRTEEGTLLFDYSSAWNIVDLKSILRVPAYKSSFAVVLADAAFVIDGESYELEDVTRSPNYTNNIIAKTVFIPAKKAYDLAISSEESATETATIIIDGRPLSLTVDKESIPNQFLGVAEVAEHAAETLPEAYEDIQKLINDPDVYVPVSIDITNPYWVQGGGGEAEH